MNGRRDTPGGGVSKRAGTEARCDERGDTLIEVLITLIVMSITAVAVLFAFSGSIAGSATHRNLVTNDVALRTVAQSVYAEVQQQATPLYSTCATSYGTPQASQQFNAPSGFTVTVAVKGYYWPKNGTYGWQTTAPSDCTTPVPQELLITLNSSPSSRVSTWIVVNGLSSFSTPFLINSITPTSALPNTTEYIAIAGTGFQSGVVGSFPAGSGVTFSGGTTTSPQSSSQPSSWTYNSTSSITAQITVAANATAGPVTFTLTNPDGTTATYPFTIGAGPTIVSVNGHGISNPPQFVIGTSSAPFDITGANFQNGAVVSITSTSGVSLNGLPTVVSSSSITSTVAVVVPQAPGPYYVTVTNPDLQVSNSFPFFVGYGQPTITMVNNGGDSSNNPCTIVFAGIPKKGNASNSAHDSSNLTCVVTGTNFYDVTALTLTSSESNGGCTLALNSGIYIDTSSPTQLNLTFSDPSSCVGNWPTRPLSPLSYDLTVTAAGGQSNVYPNAFSISASSGNG